MDRIKNLTLPSEAVSASLTALHDTQVLMHSPKRMTANERRKSIVELLYAIPETLDTDEVGIATLKLQTRNLLRSDPLSDQQAGIVARWVRYSGFLFGKRYDPNSKPASFEEVLDLMVGDWQGIERMCIATPQFATAWEKANQQAKYGDNLVDIYMGRKLSEEQVATSLQFGIFPQGLWRYGSLDGIIDKALKYPLRCQDDKENGYWWKVKRDQRTKISQLSDGPLSKIGILRNHWHVYTEATEGVDTINSLAMSTSPEKEIAIRYGNRSYVFHLRLPQSRLVRRWDEPGVVDDSVLFHIQPEAISGVYSVTNGRKPLSEQRRVV